MKIGINRWTMPADWSFERCFRSAKEAGFDTIEVNIDLEGELTLDSSESEIRRIADSAHRAGITLSSLSNSVGWTYPMTSNDPVIRAQGVELIRSAIRFAGLLGVDTVLCVPGVVTADVQYDVAYARAQDALRGLAAEAQEHGIVIGVENVWNKLLLSPLEMARFVDEIGSPALGVYFDAGNILAYGFPQHWIRILGSRIRKVHVKDFQSGIGNIRAFCNPLNGDLPWAEVRKALDEIGYDGTVTAEVDGYAAAPDLGLKHIADSLRFVFGDPA